VVTEHGAIACNAVIFAGGAWSRPFLENMGLSLPQLAVRSSAQRTGAAPAVAPGPVGAKAAAIRPRLDGGFTIGRTTAARFDIIPAAFTHFVAFIPQMRARWKMLKLRFGSEFFGALGRHRWGPDQLSPMEQARMLDPDPDHALLDDTLATAAEIFPQLKGIRPAERWGGMIDVSPDEVPFIGPVAGAEGMILASGLSGHGFGLGPGVGLLAAQLATGRDPVTDITPFRLDRFKRGG
jgi:glycine/D-amino acid oxidase-like deaminating enzyme